MHVRRVVYGTGKGASHGSVDCKALTWVQPCAARPAPPQTGSYGSSPKQVRILSTTDRAMLAAINLNSPMPQFGQRCMLMSNTRFRTHARFTNRLALSPSLASDGSWPIAAIAST